MAVRYGAQYDATNRLTLPAAEVRRLHRVRSQIAGGIRVCKDQLGLTGCQARAERDTLVKNRAAILPGRRVGTADEVAQVILMLMTNAYLTGEVVHVDEGGRFV